MEVGIFRGDIYRVVGWGEGKKGELRDQVRRDK